MKWILHECQEIDSNSMFKQRKSVFSQQKDQIEQIVISAKNIREGISRVQNQQILKQLRETA